MLSAAAHVIAAVWQIASTGVATAEPFIAFADAQGRSVGLEAFQGKVVILDFWATWCAPCRVEFPVLDRLQARFESNGLTVVAVNVNREGQTAVDAFYKQFNIVHLAKYTGDMRDITRTFRLHGLPTTIVMDREGNEVSRIDGAADLESEKIDALLTRLLAHRMPNMNIVAERISGNEHYLCKELYINGYLPVIE
jgi:thiol-disulfide isomerase/thioredoxin